MDLERQQVLDALTQPIEEAFSDGLKAVNISLFARQVEMSSEEEPLTEKQLVEAAIVEASKKCSMRWSQGGKISKSCLRRAS